MKNSRQKFHVLAAINYASEPSLLLLISLSKYTKQSNVFNMRCSNDNIDDINVTITYFSFIYVITP